MKTHLLYPDADFDTAQKLPAHTEALREDLGLDAVLDAMANRDEYLREVAAKVLFFGLPDPDAVVYRQQVLADCLAHRQLGCDLYDLAGQAIAEEKRIWSFVIRTPQRRLHRSVAVLELALPLLRRLRRAADENVRGITSPGFRTFFRMVQAELPDSYFDEITTHLAMLRFKRGVLVSAELGPGLKGNGYRVRLPKEQRARWWQQLHLRADALTITIAPRDEAGAQAIEDLTNRGLNQVANALGQSADHVMSFFRVLRYELAFYLGCANLHDRLASHGEPTCYPTPVAGPRPVLAAHGLYDVGLALRSRSHVVGNDLDADGKHLILITGANQGGKSTFLRAVGIAQLLLHAGMFVPAESFTALVRPAVFTHYKREEDATLIAGKLVEELTRMSAIVDQLTPGCLLLMNESFASTNEAEAAEIASALLQALLESEITVVCVTHTFELAHQFAQQRGNKALCLRAERLDDGQRTFRVVPETPAPTSHGEDLYRRVFGRPPRPMMPGHGGGPARRDRAVTGREK